MFDFFFYFTFTKKHGKQKSVGKKPSFFEICIVSGSVGGACINNLTFFFFSRAKSANQVWGQNIFSSSDSDEGSLFLSKKWL